MLGKSNPSQHKADHGGGVSDGAGGGERDSLRHRAIATIATASAGESTAQNTIDANLNTAKIKHATSGGTAPGAFTGKRWWLLAAGSALLLTCLTIAGVYLVTKKPSTVDQLVILTVPSGADIKLDSKDYGHSPVKLERLMIGTYTLTISKEGFEPIVEPLIVVDSGSVERKLKPVLPSETVNLPAEEQIRQIQQLSEDAFARGYHGPVYEGSALQFADMIGRLDSNNTFAKEMRERVRNAAHRSAQAAIPRGDLAQAQDIYKFLVENYEDDQEAKTAAERLENQLSARRGEVRELLRKADQSLQAGRLVEPSRTSAYYYSRQALAIDRQNEKARQIRSQVKETLAAAGEQAYKRGDVEAAIKQFEQVGQLFPEDKQSRVRVREIQGQRAAEQPKPLDSNARRQRGLDAYRRGNFEDAIPDLQNASVNGQGTQAVVFALARSYLQTGRLDQAEPLFYQVQPATGDDAHRSSVAALGDIAYKRGDSATAVERWKEARRLGGSALYPISALDDKIEQIEKKQREKAAEPSPLTLQVKHLHGGLLGGSCSGTLTINATGVRYDGQQGKHVYASNLVGVGVTLTKDDMAIAFQGNSQKFRVARADAERVRETIARYQQTYSPSSK
jgi:PEGA domain-containing protein/tetratricopeptide repeat protein